MTSFGRVEKAVSQMSRIISLIGLAGLLLLALATVLDVLLRWLFNSPIVGLNDTHSLFTALIIAASFPLCIYARGNITIRFVGNILGPRVRDILDAFGSLVTLIIFSLMAWQVWVHTNQLAQDGETTWVLYWPLSPWWRAVTILIIICVPVTLITFIQFIKSITEKKDLPAESMSSSVEQGERKV